MRRAVAQKYLAASILSDLFCLVYPASCKKVKAGRIQPQVLSAERMVVLYRFTVALLLKR